MIVASTEVHLLCSSLVWEPLCLPLTQSLCLRLLLCGFLRLQWHVICCLHPPPFCSIPCSPCSEFPQSKNSYVRRECLWENSEKTRPQFLQSAEWFLGCVSMTLPRCSGYEWADSTLLTTTGDCCVLICLYGKACFDPEWLALVSVYFTQGSLLNLQSINCPMLWMKLTLTSDSFVSSVLSGPNTFQVNKL